MNQLAFYLKCTPPTATAQQKGERIVSKGGKSFVVHYKKKPLVEAEELFKGLLRPHCPKSPITGPVQAEIEWVFPWRASEKKSVMREFERIPKDTYPDTDNSNKLLLDVMELMGFFTNDSQIFDNHPKKFWGDHPGIYVQLKWGVAIEGGWKRRREGVLL
ncbi:MAG: RusA family crossover junction endodeoxyribonuclease [Verrucomicrobiales bacterium]